MPKTAWIIAVGVVLLLASWWWARARSDQATPPSRRVARDTVSLPAEEAIVLRGPSETRAETAPPAPDAVGERAPDEAQSAAGDADADAGDARLAALLREIRRDVEPSWWANGANAVLEQRNGILIARAPSDALDAIGEFLEARRRERLAAAGITYTHDPPMDDAAADPAVAARAVGELRAVMLDMLHQSIRIEGALEALRGGDAKTAARLAGEAAGREADNALAVQLLKVANETEDRPDLRQVAWDWSNSLDVFGLLDWIDRWPSLRTAKRARDLWEEAGRPPLALRGVERDEVLERGAVSIHVKETSVRDVLRELQIRSFVDLDFHPDPRVRRTLRTPVTLSIEARPLGLILDRLLGLLPDGYAWRTASRTIQLVRADAPTPTRLRYYDLKDLRDDTARPAQAVPLSPPVPRVYYESDD